MPTPYTAPIGAPCWIDLMSSDTDRSRAFYGDLFGWTSEAGGEEYGGYITFALDGAVVAGCMGKQEGMEAMPDAWSTYLSVTDADATAAAATAAGGTVIMPVMDVMTLGRMGFLADPAGAAIGIWQAGEHAGFDVMGEPGAPAWFELHTRDFGPAVAFYAQVFGTEPHVMADEADFRYTNLREGDTDLAGIMDASAFLPEGVPDRKSVV